MSMKPIDVQNACLLELQHTSRPSCRIARNLRNAGKSVSTNEVACALGTLLSERLVDIKFHEYPTVGISQPVYALTAVGRIEARQLPGAQHG